VYQQSCLVALALLVKSVPKATFSHLMSSVVPLLIRGLDLPDEEVQASIIHALTNITEGNIIAEHASTLVSKMLKNSMVHEMPSVVSGLMTMWTYFKCFIARTDRFSALSRIFTGYYTLRGVTPAQVSSDPRAG
jgi:RNAPII transcription regulator C-terminal